MLLKYKFQKDLLHSHHSYTVPQAGIRHQRSSKNVRFVLSDKK